jgi:hypothetical protein
MDPRTDAPEGWVKPLDLSHREDTVAPVSSVNQRLGLCHRRGERFFDQKVGTSLEELLSNAQMLPRWHCQYRRVNPLLAVVDVVENAGASLCREAVRALAMRVDDADELVREDMPAFAYPHQGLRVVATHAAGTNEKEAGRKTSFSGDQSLTS